jgi:hypothetical protein
MGAERLVAAGLVLGGVAAEVAEGGGEAVGAVLPGRATERPEGILQPLGEGAAKLSPPGTTRTCCQPEKARRKW